MILRHMQRVNGSCFDCQVFDLMVFVCYKQMHCDITTHAACEWLVFRLSGKELMELQSKVEDVECLPTLSVNDIERRAERDPFVIRHKGDTHC